MNVKNIIDILSQKGKVIVLKTDTVYGFICNAYDDEAINKIYDLKNREKDKPLCIFIKDKKELIKYVDKSNLSDRVNCIIDKYWPGALTIIFNKKDGRDFELISKTNSIGIRIPNDKLILKILNKIDFPLAQTSCNISGEEPYKNIFSIIEKFEDKIDMYLDGGAVTDNVASTILSVVNGEFKIIRVGDVKLDVS